TGEGRYPEGKGTGLESPLPKRCSPLAGALYPTVIPAKSLPRTPIRGRYPEGKGTGLESPLPKRCSPLAGALYPTVIPAKAGIQRGWERGWKV
ncbi:MAG: hypothetical protein OXD46_09640, partial [Chloroflexi bacterium]|nr:hypothetical protein [Chloroflexota bacterium]